MRFIPLKAGFTTSYGNVGPYLENGTLSAPGHKHCDALVNTGSSIPKNTRPHLRHRALPVMTSLRRDLLLVPLLHFLKIRVNHVFLRFS
jgi:hypothetical protein